jgi:hypothetical protein
LGWKTDMPLDNKMGPARGYVEQRLDKAPNKTNEHNTWTKPNEYNKESLNNNNSDNSNNREADVEAFAENRTTNQSTDELAVGQTQHTMNFKGQKQE